MYGDMEIYVRICMRAYVWRYGYIICNDMYEGIM